MSVINELARKANNGELVEPSRVVEIAEAVKNQTYDYTRVTNIIKENGRIEKPPIVDANTIKKEMESEYRPTTNPPDITETDTPYFTQEPSDDNER